MKVDERWGTDRDGDWGGGWGGGRSNRKVIKRSKS